MKVLILAAGYATRLYPLTRYVPKHLLPIAGKPMLELVIDELEKIKEVTDIIILTNDKFFSHFDEWANSLKTKKPIKVISDKTRSNKDRLGAIGDMHFAIQKEKIDQDLMVIAGDNLFDFDVKKIFDFFNRKKKSVIAVYDMKSKEEVTGKFGVVELDSSGKIISFEEKPDNPKTSLAATFFYLLSKDDVDELEKCIKEGVCPDNAGDFIRYLSEKKEVYGYVFDGYWFDIGNFDHYKKANILYEKDKDWLDIIKEKEWKD